MSTARFLRTPPAVRSGVKNGIVSCPARNRRRTTRPSTRTPWMLLGLVVAAAAALTPFVFEKNERTRSRPARLCEAPSNAAKNSRVALKTIETEAAPVKTSPARQTKNDIPSKPASQTERKTKPSTPSAPAPDSMIENRMITPSPSPSPSSALPPPPPPVEKGRLEGLKPHLLFPSAGLSTLKDYIPGREGQWAQAKDVWLVSAHKVVVNEDGYEVLFHCIQELKGAKKPYTQTLTIGVRNLATSFGMESNRDQTALAAQLEQQQFVFFLTEENYYFALRVKDYNTLVARSNSTAQ